MSTTTALGVTPDRRPVVLAEFRNAYGWAASIWSRLLVANGLKDNWMISSGLGDLETLSANLNRLPDWQQVPLLLTFDTGVIPWQEYTRAAEEMDEFEAKLPAPPGHANHVPGMATLLRSKPEAPFFGVHGTSVSENPFDPWDEEDDAPGTGIPLEELVVLDRHRHHMEDPRAD